MNFPMYQTKDRISTNKNKKKILRNKQQNLQKTKSLKIQKIMVKVIRKMKYKNFYRTML